MEDCPFSVNAAVGELLGPLAPLDQRGRARVVLLAFIPKALGLAAVA